MKIADPRPALCTTCGNSGEESTRFVDCEAVREGPVVLDESGQIAVGPDGAQVVLEDVFLCDTCVREASEVAGVKPELHARQLNEIRRLELELDSVRAYARRLEAALAERPEAPVRTPRRTEKAVA